VFLRCEVSDQPPESDVTSIPPLPDQPGAFVLVKGAWKLEARTEPPAPTEPQNDGPDTTPAADGGAGADLRDVSGAGRD
jgi:hypothetical protein